MTMVRLAFAISQLRFSKLANFDLFLTKIYENYTLGQEYERVHGTHFGVFVFEVFIFEVFVFEVFVFEVFVFKVFVFEVFVFGVFVFEVFVFEVFVFDLFIFGVFVFEVLGLRSSFSGS